MATYVPSFCFTKLLIKTKICLAEQRVVEAVTACSVQL